jgi:3-hydroxy-9,10-secoandrosta-1,3,5(10)-triene-9,17-dione monooxygenase reductase component
MGDRTGEDDERAYRRALGGFATGIALIAAEGAAGPAGIVVNSFTSVSLEPRLVLWCLGDASDRFQQFSEAGRWSVSVLAAEHEAICAQVARPGAWAIGDLPLARLHGAPVLAGALAHLVCTTVERRRLGDHLAIVGEVGAYASADGAGLTYFRGRYGRAEPG